MGLSAAELLNEQFDFASMAKSLIPFSRIRKKLIGLKYPDAIALTLACQSMVARIAMLTHRVFRIYSIQAPHLPAFHNRLSCAV